MDEVAALTARARAAGVAASYLDIAGRRRRVPVATLRVTLLALEERGRALPPRRLLPAVAASFAPAPARIPLLASARGRGLRWSLEALEDGGRELAGEAVDAIEAGELACGYYRLSASLDGVREECLVVRAPARAWLPPALRRGRGYGIAVQLYELLGPTSIGLGDFSDLTGLARAAGGIGADALGLNPLHALYLSNPAHASPYSPNSRLALNPLYLDVRRLPGFDAELRARLDAPAFRARVRALNAQPLIDYPGAAREKLALARAAFERFRDAGGDIEFEHRLRSAGDGMRAWAEFETVAAVHGSDARRWPPGLTARNAAAFGEFVRDHAAQYEFHLWLQWQARVQLGEAVEAARAAGMGVGLYQDLALGADPGGAEVWAAPEVYVDALSVGAPPDPLNPRGQNWGFPPFHPHRLLESGLAPFVALIRANMRCAGALRIDHVLGLNRLFVIPRGAEADAGTYLRYPLAALLAVLTLESHRARCLVIGEDLGTVPRGLRARLARRGIFSLRLLYFEHEAGGRPRAPGDYPRDALAAIGTHDLAPFAGWWRGSDLARMDRLGLWPDAGSRAAAHAARPRETALLTETLVRSGLHGARAVPPAAAAYRWLARSRSRLVMIQPEDGLGVVDPVNVPGTVAEEPNWRRRRLPPWPRWLADPRFAALVRAVRAERGGRQPPPAPLPTATYRVQLQADFDFASAAARLGYLARLGISHLYVSPVLAAVPASSHGYDMIDPARLDPGRGGEAGFAALSGALRRERIGLLVDFVPNHMGAHHANPWWLDLLEWGRASAYAAAFDVDWSAADGRVVLPVLGGSLEECAARGEIGLRFSPEGRFFACYHEHRFPLAPESCTALLVAAARRLAGADGAALIALARGFRRLLRMPAGRRRVAGLSRQADISELALRPAVRDGLESAAADFGADGERLLALLERQHWRLAYWREGMEAVNYRRFFDIATLAAVRLERDEVFAAMHERIRALVAGGDADGLRLDHVDGLAAPGRYLDTLAALGATCTRVPRLWVEKILGDEEMPPAWPIEGTTGYEFLNDVTRVFLSQDGIATLRELWCGIVPGAPGFDETLETAKRETAERLLAPMLDRTARALAHRAPVAEETLRKAILEAVVAVPVYRAYPGARGRARVAQQRVVDRAVAAATAADGAAGAWLGEVLAIAGGRRARLPGRLRDGVARFWQLAAAAMAKGLEDTAFYRYGAVLALNEVGGDPRLPALDAGEFHRRMRRRMRAGRDALNAGATHDTKRGEDARLRLAMLSEHADAWSALVPELAAAAAPLRPARLHRADEYLLWQTLLSIWPPPCEELDADVRESLQERLSGFLVKALREGKQRSSWLAPDEAYEASLCGYAAALLAPDGGRAFRRLLLPFAGAVARSGALASLAALTLRCTAPGIPDIYQGGELWDLSLVDPDNRRAVDFGRREQWLRELGEGGESVEPARLLGAWPDGRIKLVALARLLDLRRRRPRIFAEGGYRALAATGTQARRVIAFQRGSGRTAVTVIVAKPGPALQADAGCALSAAAWGDTGIALPGSGRRRDLLGGRLHAGRRLAVGTLLAPLPAAVLIED